MSQIKASPEAVRQLARDLRTTINNLQDISTQVKSAGNVSDQCLLSCLQDGLYRIGHPHARQCYRVPSTYH